MMRRRLVSLGLTSLLLVATGVAAAERTRDHFPHRKHERVFPVCEGCHAGVLTGNTAQLFPTPADCAECHDGQHIRRVDWEPPTGPRASNLRFSHVTHIASTDSAGVTAGCQSCHAADASGKHMSVAGPQPALCVRCHAHEASSHTAREARCGTCHVPLVEAASLDTASIANFPRPLWHQDSDFVEQHGAIARASTASCTVCHARESCERCHANADRVPQIASLAADPRVASLTAGKAATYPEPASHHAADWQVTHGATARAELSRCANCHTRTSCSTCHQNVNGTAALIIASLPLPRAGGASGVSPERMKGRVHQDDVVHAHGAMARAGRPDCTQCHETRWCEQCHAAQQSAAFHPPNFVERHAADAFAKSGDCQTCHRSETFCRACHSRAGVATNGKMTAAFHTAQGSWVLTHGQAARRGLETCVACHSQNDCLRCHSASGGWGVNPHGPGFNADGISSHSGASCRVCHTKDPVSGKRGAP